MVDYWKSQPKKFCEFCKVWIADNKPSIEFHEKGKKHKEFVQAKISEVKKNSAKKREIQEKLDSDLAAIEAAALKAYEKDLARNKPVEYGPEPRPGQNIASSVTSESDEQSVNTATAEETLDSWAAYQTPEGYTYYYNSVTGESTWEPPLSFQQVTEVNTGTAQSKESEDILPIAEDSSNTKDKTSSKESRSKPAGPFGAWTTVAVYERESETNAKTDDDEEEKQRAAEEEKARLKFKEKQTPKLNIPKTDFSEESAQFKKRKFNQDKKKRNIRQRTDDS